jgi:uncharacterized protein YecT (DUF1311 family)
MKLPLLLLANTLLFFLSIYGQEQHKIEKELDACLAIDSNQSTAGMNRCVYLATEQWDKELNKYYGLLMGSLDSAGQHDLREAQRQWIVYRDKEFKFILTLYYGQMQGTMWTNVASMSRLKVVKQRAIELRSHYEMLVLE